MTATAIQLRPWERGRHDDSGFYAIALGHNARGDTAGEALDALLAGLAPGEQLDRIVVGRIGDDEFYSTIRSERIAKLTERLAEERCGGLAMTDAEKNELEQLVEEDLESVVQRSEAISAALQQDE